MSWLEEEISHHQIHEFHPPWRHQQYHYRFSGSNSCPGTASPMDRASEQVVAGAWPFFPFQQQLPWLHHRFQRAAIPPVQDSTSPRLVITVNDHYVTNRHLRTLRVSSTLPVRFSQFHQVLFSPSLPKSVDSGMEVLGSSGEDVWRRFNLIKIHIRDVIWNTHQPPTNHIV